MQKLKYKNTRENIIVHKATFVLGYSKIHLSASNRQRPKKTNKKVSRH